MDNPTEQKPQLISEQMAELSDLVEKLEDPTIELEYALVLYEKGITLTNNIQAKLEAAEQRVAVVAADDSISTYGGASSTDCVK